MKKIIKYYKNAKVLSKGAALFIAQIAKTEVKKKGYFTMVLSGGESPVETYRSLAALDIPWKYTYIFWQDDRFVKYSDKDSNVKLVYDNLIVLAGMKFDKIYPVPAPDNIKSPTAAALAYELIINELFLKLQPGMKIPSLDLIITGMGKDGHTASLFPGDKALKEKIRLIISVKAPKGFAVKNRITMTLPFMNNAKNVLMIITGNEKSKIVGEAINGNRKYPAALLQPKQRLIWMIERS